MDLAMLTGLNFRTLLLSLASVALLSLSHCTNPQTDATDSAAAPESAKAFLPLQKITPVPVLPEDSVQPSPEPKPQALRYLETGRRRFDEGLWADAAAAIEKALQIEPDLHDARIMLARTAIQQGDLALARNHLEEVVRARPRDPAVYQLLGEIALQQNRTTDAIALLRLALLAGSPDEPQRSERVLAHLSLALALREEGYLAAASDQLRAFQSAIQNPTPEMDQRRELHEVVILYRTKAPALLGEIESELGRHDRAVDAYRKAVDASPDDKTLQKALILELARAGDADEALRRVDDFAAQDDNTDDVIDLLRQVCKLTDRSSQFVDRLVSMARRSSRVSAKLTIARILTDEQQSSQAAKVLSDVVEADPSQSEAWILLARLRLKLGEPDRAIEVLHQILNGEDAADRLVREFISEARSSGMLPRLIDAAKRSAAAKPDDASSAFLVAAFLFASDRADEAQQACDPIVTQHPDFVPAVVLDAQIALQRHDWQQALEKADAAIDRDISSPALQSVIGQAYVALGESQKAETAFFEAFRLDRDDPNPLFKLAEMHERAGEFSRAENLYRRILDDVNPRYLPAREQLIRILLNTRKGKRAKEYFADFKRLGLTGAPVERCRALMNLAESSAPSGKQRLEEYRAALKKIIADYPNESATHLALAMTFEATGDLPEAKREIDAAVAADPFDINCLDRKADYESKLLEYDAAAETLTTLLKLRPHDNAYSQRLARLALAQGDLKTAADQFTAQLKRADTDELKAPVITQLVAVLKLARRFDECVETAQQWYDAAPKDISRRVLLLSALRGAERNDEAVKQAGDWLSDDPTSSELRRMYVGQLSAAGKHVEAQQRVLTWLAANPEDYDLNDLLIRLFWQVRDWDSAIELAQTGMELPRMEGVYGPLLGRSYRLARRFEEAAELYRRMAGGPDGSREDLQLLQTLIEAQRYQEAEKEAMNLLNRQLNERAISDGYDPRVVIDMRQILSRVYQLTERPSQANQQLEEILALTPTDPGINNDLGYTWADQGVNLDRAEKMIRYALGEEPLNGAYLDSLGWVFYKQGKFAESVKYLRRAILLASSEDAVLHDHLADALYRLGNTDEARENWNKSLEISGPEQNVFPSPDDEALRERVQLKLAALNEGQTPQVAPLARPEPSTQPAADEKSDE